MDLSQMSNETREGILQVETMTAKLIEEAMKDLAQQEPDRVFEDLLIKNPNGK